ncbi:MAG: metal-dependent hydrolase [Gammaproteobacteria bacterium]
MDPATHALFGALAGQAAAPGSHAGTRYHPAWIPATITAIAGVFPDIDYVMFPVNPLTFLSAWHQSYTHSLVMLPLWTIVLTGTFLLVFPGLRQRWLMTAGLAALGLASHILLDLLTVYGTRIYFPVSSRPYSLGTTFVVDPIFSLFVLAGLVISCRRAPRLPAVSCIVIVVVYVLFQWRLMTHARETGAAAPGDVSETVALAQPFSPFHWRVIRRENDGYSSALIDLLGVSEKLTRWNHLSLIGLASAYRDAAGAKWEKYTLYGEQAEQQALARTVWEHSDMTEFRNFAVFPVLYRIDRDADATTCVWFSDLRYHISIMIPSFRYGMCRSAGKPEWQRYRLRYFTANDRRQF